MFGRRKKKKAEKLRLASGSIDLAVAPRRRRSNPVIKSRGRRVVLETLPSTGDRAPLVPVVLHHGIFNIMSFKLGKLRISSFSGGIERAIATRGHPLIVTKVHPTAGIARRAAQLKESILGQLADMGRPDDAVIIIAHSMGGLDARYMISCLDMADRVKALVTISTPHRGSAYADWCRGNLGQRLRAFKLAKLLHIDIGALDDLTLDSCRAFNEAVPDSPLVRYFSVSGARPRKKIPAFALHSWKVINRIEGENDGLVSVKSSIWGKHLGVWPVDHWHEVNKRFVIRNGVGNITPYYLRLLDEVDADGIRLASASEQFQETVLA